MGMGHVIGKPLNIENCTEYRTRTFWANGDGVLTINSFVALSYVAVVSISTALLP
jgi:hypothetical protein